MTLRISNAYEFEGDKFKYAGAYIVKTVIPFEEIIKPAKAAFNFNSSNPSMISPTFISLKFLILNPHS